MKFFQKNFSNILQNDGILNFPSKLHINKLNSSVEKNSVDSSGFLSKGPSHFQQKDDHARSQENRKVQFGGMDDNKCFQLEHTNQNELSYRTNPFAYRSQLNTVILSGLFGYLFRKIPREILFSRISVSASSVSGNNFPFQAIMDNDLFWQNSSGTIEWKKLK
jgi:hypothetical protein